MGLRDRLRAALAHSDDDGEADPQARDREFSPWATTTDVDRTEPDSGSIEDWTAEYKQNALISRPTKTFTSDVLEPGVRVDLGIGEDGDPPEVSGYPDDAFNGLPLDEALEKWLAEAGIVDGEFGHDIGAVLEKALKDLIGRRGTAIIERVYDDREEQNRLMGLRPFKAETVTAYTREGQSILLRPDDDAADAALKSGDPDAATVHGPGEGSRTTLPQTQAGQTAAYVQYDDVFLEFDEDEVRFAQDDVVKMAHDADTAEVFGRPATAVVYDRASALRQQYNDLDQALKAVAYSHFIAEVDTTDQDEASDLLSNLDPANPETVSVVSYGTDVQHHQGTVPDIDATLKQEIEYILSEFPVPLYRIGFEGDINRDVTSEQGSDYQRTLSEWREDIADSFEDVLQAKAAEFVADPPAVELSISSPPAESPLEDEDFDADAFSTLMQGLKAAAPGGAVEQVVPPEEVRETFLGLDAEPQVEGDDPLPELDESDEQVRAAFFDAYTTELARQFGEGDVVDTPDGLGVVSEVRTEPFEGKDREVDASNDSPAYVVALEDASQGVGFYTASELSASSFPEMPVDSPEENLVNGDEEAEEALLQEGFFNWPESWEEAPEPARLIALRAWANMGGRFRGCRREMAGEVTSPSRFCADFKDRILGWEGWREGG